ncbi:MAG: hypothetical protein DRP47_09580, partial [Candidatus Zixiibacteriota bacterium]
MEVQAVNLGAALIFLSALVIISRFRRKLMMENLEAYRYISSGLIIVTLVTVAHLFNSTGIFSSVPFLSEPIFFKLTGWIATITGVVLLANGISGWLSIGHSFSGKSEKKNNRYDLLKEIEQLVAVESRTSVILKITLEHIVKQFKVNEGAVFIYGRQNQKMHFLSGISTLSSDVSHLEQIVAVPSDADDSHAEEWQVNENIHLDIPSDTNTPNMLLPIRADGKLAALVLLWTGSRNIENENLVVLKLAMDIVGRTLVSRKQKIEIEHLNNKSREVNRLQNIIDCSGNFDDNMVKIARLLRELIETEYVSLTVAYSNRDSRRFTVGQNGTLLSEKGIDSGWQQDISKTKWGANAPVTVSTDIEEIPQFVHDILNSSNLKKFIVVPVVERNRTTAVLLLGFANKSGTSSRNFDILKSIIPVFGRLIEAEISRYNEEQFRRRHALINRFLANCTTEPEMSLLYQKAANILLKELKTSAVRIATFEEDGTFLKSRALSLSHVIGNMVPHDGYMIMSLMPFHRLVRDNGRLMVINQENHDGQMSVAEARQMYHADLKSALLIPIVTKGKVRGIISLADRRRRERFQYTTNNVLFASSIAATLALASTSYELSETVPVEQEHLERESNVTNM